MQQPHLLAHNPLLLRSIRNRFPYLDPLNHVQVELLKLHRGRATSEKVLTGIQLTIHGVSAGLRHPGRGSAELRCRAPGSLHSRRRGRTKHVEGGYR